jgi:lysozyme
MMDTVKQRVLAAVLTLSSLGALGIVAHEGMRKVAYVDPVGVVTVCAGHTATAKLGQVKTEAECAELLKTDVKVAERAIKRLVVTPLTQEQFDALTSFVFNVGETAFANSTMLKKINAFDCLGAGKEFSRWTKAGGKELPGLVVRRASERAQWEKGCPRGVYKTNYRPTAGAQDAPYPVRHHYRRPEHSPSSLLALTP